MSAVAMVEKRAVDRLAELGLSVELVERVLRQADAEASMCTEFDPPIIEGLMRWARTSRYLREELVPLGWTYDNPRGLARTIHPDGEFAIVAATGDELTGLADLLPATRHRRGDATAQAIAVNEQLTFDFGDLFGGVDLHGAAAPGAMLTWLLLTHSDEHEFRAELSLPDRIEDGRITGWAERIILPPFPRDSVTTADVRLAGDGTGEHVVVEVRSVY